MSNHDDDGHDQNQGHDNDSAQAPGVVWDDRTSRREAAGLGLAAALIAPAALARFIDPPRGPGRRRPCGRWC